MTTAFGAQTAWRQLVDLIGRGRAPANDMAIARLRAIRPQVPSTIRAASARALAFARPPAPLVRLFAEEDLAISAPVLRMAELTSAEWTAMLADLSPAARSVLRHRRDLSPEVCRALEAYGPIDFILPPSAPVPLAEHPEPLASAPAPEPAPQPDPEPTPELAPASTIEAALPGEAEPVGEQVTLVDAPAMAETDVAVAVVDSLHSPASVEAERRVIAANDVEAAIEAEEQIGVTATLAAPVSDAVYEPLSVDWTAVVAARPPVPAPAAVRALAPTAAPLAPAVSSPDAVAGPADSPMIADRSEPDTAAAAMPIDGTLDTAPEMHSSTLSFVAISNVAFGLPFVVNALRQQEGAIEEAIEDSALPDGVGTPADSASSPPAPAPPVQADAIDQPLAEAVAEPDAEAVAEPVAEVVAGAGMDHADQAISEPATNTASDVAVEPVAPRGPFQISDLVARIDAFQRQRDDDGRPVAGAQPGAMIANDIGDNPATPEGFSFETDAQGVVVWVSGVSRAALIGVSLNAALDDAAARVDGVVTGAFRRRSAFTQARLLIEGQSDAAGQWRISGVPVFDRASGRFTGYRGTARRPRADERAEPAHAGRSPATDSLRQLVHELRTPTTAIAGFAEMIEGELLGPVPSAYRGYAITIRDQALGLLGAIDDLDTAARIEAHALELRPTDIPVALLLQRIALDLEPLCSLRGTALALDISAGDVAIRGDDRAVDRLFARLLAALVAAGSAGEKIGVRMGREGDETVAIHIDRPRALAAYVGDALLLIDAEAEAEAKGAPLLGTGFALRLARNLAVELGGSLTIGVDRLTLRLPAAFTHDVGQASIN